MSGGGKGGNYSACYRAAPHYNTCLCVLFVLRLYKRTQNMNIKNSAPKVTGSASTPKALVVRTDLRCGSWCYDPYWGWYSC